MIEQDKHYVGGISRTVSCKGFQFDIGGHRFFSKSRQAVALWNAILPDDFSDRPRLSRIYYAGKFYAYPLKAFEALRNLGLVRPKHKWRGRRERHGPPLSFSWVRASHAQGRGV